MSTEATSSEEGPGVARTYDHFDPATARGAVAIWAELRGSAPCAWSDRHGGFHILTRYQDVWAAATDWKTFSSAQKVSIPPAELPNGLPIECDPPAHREYRRILNPALSPEQARRSEPAIRALARDLLGRFPPAGTFDFTESYADPLPKLVVLEAVGIPAEDRQLLTGIVTEVASKRDGDLQTQVDSVMRLVGYLAEKVAARKAEPPRDDVLGALVGGSVDGLPLGDEEVIGNMITVLFGGLHTTTALLNGMAKWLIEHPGARQHLERHPEQRPAALEELIRYLGPSSGIGRVATTDTEVAGCPIAAGTRVMLSFGAANFDPEAFERPDEVVLDRPHNRHLTFGAGPHRCVGSHLARQLLKVSLEELLPVIGDFEVAVAEDQLTWFGGESRGLVGLPLRGA